MPPIQGDPHYNAYERDIAVVNIFFGESTVFGANLKTLKIFRYSSSEFERSKKMTWFDFFSSIGGICGLCLGMSAISIVEFIYWFTVRFGENFADWNRNLWRFSQIQTYQFVCTVFYHFSRLTLVHVMKIIWAMANTFFETKRKKHLCTLSFLEWSCLQG